MAIVIGAATSASFMSACVISANWSYSPNVQRLYCIGEWVPQDANIYYRPTETMSLTIYSPGDSYSTAPSEGCEDAGEIQASITPVGCGAGLDGFSGAWQVNSYSFSKEDASMPGQESWSLTRWKNLTTASPPNTVEPDWVLRGISEGSSTGNAGIEFTGTTIETTTGSVSANSFGKADTLTTGVVESVGGGTDVSGETGQGSVSIPYTPLYIGS